MFVFILLFLVYLTKIPSTGSFAQDFYWRDYAYRDVPCDAYQAAPGRYIGQVNFKGFNLPATIYANNRVVVTDYGTKQTVTEDIKILCSPDNSRFYWEYVDLQKAQDQQLQDAVKGGFQESVHYPLFIGKIVHENEWKIGRVFGYETLHVIGLWVWNGSQPSVNFLQFFILKYNNTAICHNQYNNQYNSCSSV